MVSEWPRSANSTRSVTASEWRYCLRGDFVVGSGAGGSFPPPVSSSGPRALFAVFTPAGGWGGEGAAAAPHRGLAAGGIVHRSCRAPDSSSDSALPKL